LLTFTAATNNPSITVTPATATVNIADDDVATITVATTDGAEPNTNGSFVFTMSKASATNTTITYTVGGTATNGTDYTTIPTTATILAGQTTVTVSVTVTNDQIVEGNETVLLTFTAATNNPSITVTPANATVNIADDDVATITVATTDGAEPNTNGSFVFTMSKASATNTTITYTVGGTATNGTDYTTIPTTATILAGQTTVTVPVTVTNDQIVEGNETVLLTFTAATNNPSITVTPATATVNIADD
ncbi:Calx-beta domain-containing protein, partial [Pedobacter miscanthi]|uniref:Calx-beta domain-containing protein n=1 Tax=Pedobacter miscanthi TaxID=2259170 RepID=UPI00292CD044